MAKSSTSFKKGLIPWCKGKKRPETSGENNPAKSQIVRDKISERMKGDTNPMKRPEQQLKQSITRKSSYYVC